MIVYIDWVTGDRYGSSHLCSPNDICKMPDGTFRRVVTIDYCFTPDEIGVELAKLRDPRQDFRLYQDQRTK